MFMNVIQCILIFIPLICVICESHLIDEQSNYTLYIAHHYEFNLSQIITANNEAIIDENNLKITCSNITTLSFIINDKITLDLLEITASDDLRSKYPIFRSSSSAKRRLFAKSSNMKSITDQQHKLNQNHMSRVFNEHSKRLHDQTNDLKTQILKEMEKGFEENDKKTALLTKIDELKHQQKDLELQHKLLQSRKKEKKQLDTQRNKMIQQQIEWEKQSESERQKAIEYKEKKMTERHRLRLKEHEQLMKGLKAFLYSFDTMMQNKRAQDLIAAKRKSKQINDKMLRREKEIEKRTKNEMMQQLQQQSQAQMTMFPWAQYMNQQMNQQMRPYRRIRPKIAQRLPPLLPPIPPLPRRRLMAMEQGFELLQKCVLDDVLREICIGFNMENGVILVDVLHGDELDMMHMQRYFVHIYEFRMEDVKMCDDRNDNMPFNICFNGDDNMRNVVIYLESVDDERLSRLEFEWKDNEQWNKVIHFDGRKNEKRVTKCVDLIVMELCVENVAADIFEIQLKMAFDDEFV